MIEINGKKYRKLKSMWNDNFFTYKKKMKPNGDIVIESCYPDELDIIDIDKWVMIDGIEYEEIG